MTILKEPVGPVAAFAPWNFPIGNPARKIGAALGAGCPCILKPAEEAPASALEVARALEDAGLPRGVLSVVFGVPSEISTYLLASPVIRAISFTGSVPVGKQLMKLAAEGMKRTTMELGGHAPVLVFDGGSRAVLDMAVFAKYRNAGQVCVSPTRFYVQEKIYERFVAGFSARARALRVGDGLNDTTQMGPLAHDRRLQAMESLLGDARKQGARFDAGGARIEGKGFFWEPTVLSSVSNDARIMGSLTSRAHRTSSVIRSQSAALCLAAFAFTRSARTVNLIGEQVEAGMIGINSFQISVPESPFGGVKESGHGSEEGIEGLDACLVTKFVSEA
jgi:succinate-semialdehyde dehydrogenase/glutarate-semialdehyde dehydrogenase